MTYSFTQISQYLRCPRTVSLSIPRRLARKRRSGLDDFWSLLRERLGSLFPREDSTAVFFKEWQEHQDAALQYTKNDSWDRLYHQGVHLLERFAQDDRVRIRRPKKNLQVN